MYNEGVSKSNTEKRKLKENGKKDDKTRRAVMGVEE